MKLVNADGIEIKVGDLIKKGEAKYIVKSILEPERFGWGSSGKITVRGEGSIREFTYFVTVFDLKWVEK